MGEALPLPCTLLSVVSFIPPEGAAQADLLSADHAADVFPVLPEDGEGGNADDGCQDHVVGKQADIGGHRGNNAEGADHDIVGKDRCQNQNQQGCQGQFPVQRQDQTEKGSRTLAALEFQIEGKYVAENSAKSRHKSRNTDVMKYPRA